MVHFFLAVRAGPALHVVLSGGLGVFPRFSSCFCKFATVTVKVVLLEVRVALLFTSAAKIYFSVVAALANELNYPSSSSNYSCGRASGASGSGTLSKAPWDPK